MPTGKDRMGAEGIWAEARDGGTEAPREQMEPRQGLEAVEGGSAEQPIPGPDSPGPQEGAKR